MKKEFISWFIFMLPLLAQAQASFEAFTDARQVVLNSYFDVTFMLRNAEGENFTPPSFDNFSVLAGPARSLSTTIVNGKVSKELGYTYTIQPRRKGKFSIGSASIRADGKILRTKPIQIEIVASKDLGKNNAVNQVFVRAELSSEKAFIGQQITLDYKLYTAVNVDSYSILEESQYPGFFAEDLRRFDDPPTREVIKGVQYVTKILKRVALFPQQAGTLAISPLRLEMAIFKENPKEEGFLFNRQVQRIFVETAEVKLNVVALPPNPPASFSGAVGDYTADFSINRKDVSTDDALSIRLTLSGNGDIKRAQPPQLAFSDSFEVYDPKVLGEDFSENLNGELTGKKEIEYLVLPKKAGKFKLQPAFSYFDPNRKKYITNQTTFDILVSQGSQPIKESGISQNSSPAPDDILFIKTDLQLSKTNTNFFGTSVFWTLTVLPFLLFGGIILIKRNQIQRSKVDPTQLRIKRARQEALNRLKSAEQHLKTNASRAFHDEISKALLGYVCDKLQIPGSELSKENVREQLHSLKVDEILVNDFMGIIQICEVALFSGKDNPTSMNDIYQRAVDNLSKMEEFLKTA